MGQGIKMVSEVLCSSPVNISSKSTDLEIKMLYAWLSTSQALNDFVFEVSVIEVPYGN